MVGQPCPQIDRKMPRKARWPVEVQCDVFGVSRSGYYAWKGRPEAPRAREDAEVVIEIKTALLLNSFCERRPMLSDALVEDRRLGATPLVAVGARCGLTVRAGALLALAARLAHPSGTAGRVPTTLRAANALHR